MKKQILNLDVLNRKNQNKGFTLIEVLVVVIIIGVLTAASIPILFEQVEKSRQVEARLNLGNLNRVQQAYRFENGTFGLITDLPVNLSAKYYTYTDVGTPDSQSAIHIATVVPIWQNDLRDYSSAVGQVSGGNYNSVVCEQDNPDGAVAPIPATVTAGVTSCTAGTNLIF